jgi:anti-anti-sigma factor
MAFISTGPDGFGQLDDAQGGAFIHNDTDPRAAIIHVFGEATFADVREFESLIVSAVRIGRLVVLDMRECSYMDCATIGVIVRAAKMLGDQLRLVFPRASQGYRMLDLTGLVKVLHVSETLDASFAPIVTSSRLHSVNAGATA